MLGGEERILGKVSREGVAGRIRRKLLEVMEGLKNVIWG